jgi:nucleoside-diphosphate-sugar epimerase
MKILVTGAGGFIGQILAAGLHSEWGYDVVGLCRDLAPGPVPGVTWVKSDLAKEIPLEVEADFIVHCAAEQNSQVLSVKELIDKNLAMMENVVRYAKKARVKGIVFSSSIDIHGEVVNDLLDEGTGIINPSAYGVSKYLCEVMLRECQASVPAVSLRLCGVIGPGARNGWIAKVLSKALNGEDISIFNEDRLFNNIVHTDDLLRFLRVLFLQGFSGFTAFPIASKTPVSIRAAITQIINASGSSSKIIKCGVTANSFMISNDFAMSRFKYEPSGVVDNLNKYVREMSRQQACSGLD